MPCHPLVDPVIEFFHFLGYTVLVFIAGAWWGIFWTGKK